MRIAQLPLIAALMALMCTATRAQPRKTLEVYFIDVEGGQSTLLVSPSGQSLLIDAGWPGARDADRITAVAKLAGIARIDFLVLTHYHVDHAGGVPELASRIPIRNFVDHGPTFDPLVTSLNITRPISPCAKRASTFWPNRGKRFPSTGLTSKLSPLPLKLFQSLSRVQERPTLPAPNFNPRMRSRIPWWAARISNRLE